jgi:RNA recognition motif-containing protein
LLQGKSVRVNNSQSKHRLFVGGIPRDLSKEELRKHLDEVTVGAESIDLPTVSGLIAL